MMKLIISDQAVSDLTDIWAYIARDTIAAADRFVDRLYQQCQRLAEAPKTGRQRDELLPGLRSFPVGRYLLFYRVEEERVEVVRVLSGYRDLDSLF
ncbi:MAG: type II toxin-antitoxin system RelE/ParE family toxin [Armatimonadetes bacterium]|nr:type II toxin-antitoxin system RelE/ParE family toxin [Armatimonadota bacterium]